MARRGRLRTSRASRERKERWRNKYPNRYLLNSAKYRAKKHGLPFDITPDDIEIPKECPALGIPLIRGTGRRTIQPNSPTLDRIIPEKGYVKGNVIVVSAKANRIKSDSNTVELIQVALFYKRLIDSLANPSHRR